jgi:hypothetical protein
MTQNNQNQGGQNQQGGQQGSGGQQKPDQQNEQPNQKPGQGGTQKQPSLEIKNPRLRSGVFMRWLFDMLRYNSWRGIKQTKSTATPQRI